MVWLVDYHNVCRRKLETSVRLPALFAGCPQLDMVTCSIGAHFVFKYNQCVSRRVMSDGVIPRPVLGKLNSLQEGGSPSMG